MSLTSPPPSSYLLRMCTATGPFEFTDLYLDVAWSPITGPTVVQLLRAVNVAIFQAGSCVRIETAELAGLIGVAPMRAVHAIQRAERYGLLRSGVDGDLLVPAKLHGPSDHHMRRLSVRSLEAAELCRERSAHFSRRSRGWDAG